MFGVGEECVCVFGVEECVGVCVFGVGECVCVWSGGVCVFVSRV